MTSDEVKIGHSYHHDFGDGRVWRVIVNRLVGGVEDLNPAEWVGCLDGDQGGIEDGARVWGRISELKPIKEE